MTNQLPPHDRDAERAILGSLLIDNDAWMDTNEILQAQMFYIVHHQQIYKVMSHLMSKEEPAIDSLLVIAELRRRGHINYEDKTAIKESDIIGLVSVVPTSINARHYAQIVHRLHKKRKLIAAGSKIASLGYSDDAEMTTDDLCNQASSIVLSIQQSQTQDKLYTPEYYTNEYESHIKRGRVFGIKTGLVDVDRLIGCMENQKMYIVAAVQKAGKTSLMVGSIGYNVVTQPSKPVVTLFCLESGEIAMVRRFISRKIGVSPTRLKQRDLTREELIAEREALEEMRQYNLIIDTTAAITPSQIRAKLHRVMMMYGQIDLVIVDYMQLMRADQRGYNQDQDLISVSKGLLAIAKDFDVPVLVGGQLRSKAIAERKEKRPRPEDFHGTSQAYSDCDAMFLIYREYMYEPEISVPSDAELILVHRDGAPDNIPLYFHAESMWFGSAEMARIG